MEGEKFFNSDTNSKNEREEDIEKAHEIALARNAYEDLARAYEQYLADPDSFREERTVELEEDGSNFLDAYKNNRTIEIFQRLEKNGMKSDKIRSYIESEEEITGKTYDYKAEIKNMSNLQLRVELAKTFAGSLFDAVRLSQRDALHGERLDDAETSEVVNKLYRDLRAKGKRESALYAEIASRKNEHE